MLVAESTSALIRACQAGDQSAIETLLDSYSDRVYSVALRFAGEPAAAADIAQDVLIKLVGALREFSGTSSFETWLYRIVVNSCIDHSRRNRRWLVFDKIPESRLARWEDPVKAVARTQIRRDLARAVRRLEPELRIAVVLRYTQALSYAQIAEILGCPAGTVASRLNRAHKKLGSLLERDGWKDEDLNLYE